MLSASRPGFVAPSIGRVSTRKEARMRWGCLVVVTTVCLALYPSSINLRAQQASAAIDWTQYHNHSQVTSILQGFAAKYKNVAKLYSIGKSVQGKDLWCLEITNYATGAPETKPGQYIDGNTHSGEVSGAEVCLYIINHLLTNHGKDALITRLVDTRVFYILPKINPDGSDAYLAKPATLPDANLKKVDDNAGGRLDRVVDLDGDGIISMMRIRDENGPLKTSPTDPRLMVPRRIDEKGEWRILGPEGIDNDNDGRINEDPPPGARTVTNRNYPAFWAPNWVQGGSLPGGDYPLSEPEARAQIEFIVAHPNIASVQAYHTHSGVILRPYSNQGDELIPRQDMENFTRVGAIGTELTGYPVLSIYNDFTPNKAGARHGVFIDWAYDFFGAFALTTELWKAPGETGKSTFDTFDENLAMQWNDRELRGAGFVNWKKFNHPQLGEVEIGGWNSNFFSQNPPPKFTEAEWKKNCLFEIKRAELLPSLQIADVKTVGLGDRLVRVTAVIRNDGALPTNVTQKAIEHRIARPVEVRLELDKAELLAGRLRTDIGHIEGTAPPSAAALYTSRGNVARNQRSVEWLIRLKGDGASVKITASSPRAGTASRTVPLKIS
jgi:Zinc carboxypeptidase